MTSNKKRERLHHLAKKHYRARLDEDLRGCGAQCPRCGLAVGGRQALRRHYMRRHGVLEAYLAEDMGEWQERHRRLVHEGQQQVQQVQQQEQQATTSSSKGKKNKKTGDKKKDKIFVPLPLKKLDVSLPLWPVPITPDIMKLMKEDLVKRQEFNKQQEQMLRQQRLEEELNGLLKLQEEELEKQMQQEEEELNKLLQQQEELLENNQQQQQQGWAPRINPSPPIKAYRKLLPQPSPPATDAAVEPVPSQGTRILFYWSPYKGLYH